mgnify:FL=1
MLLKPEVLNESINIESKFALKDFSDTLFMIIRKNIEKGYKSIVFVCRGTDRSTGDSLGPLVGYKIGKLRTKNIYVHGNLDSPVHAKNLDHTVKMIYEKYNKPFIIAVDACLGKMEHVGFINIGEGSIKPGSGVNKNLNPVGDMYITGIVNFGGFMDFLVLQNTRLSLVMRMADIISMGIKHVLWKISNDADITSIFYDS